MSKDTEKQEIYNDGDEWSQERYRSAEKSLVMSRAINFGLIIICILLGLSLALALPLKTLVPWVITVDNQTGRVDVVEVLKEQVIPVSEAMNKYWINQYLICREGYDYQDVEECYNKVIVMSGADVIRDYANAFDPNGNENSPLNVYGDKSKVKLKVRHISFLDADTATVRIQKMISGVKAEREPIYEVVTLSFEYDSKPAKESDRLINPLGFKVTSYRNDPEVVQ